MFPLQVVLVSKKKKCKFCLDRKSVLANHSGHSKIALVFHTHEAHYQKCFPEDIECDCEFVV